MEDTEVLEEHPAPRPVQARQCSVVVGEVVDQHYPVGVFESDGYLGASAPSTVAAIVIAEAEGRLVLALPADSWNKATAKRVLPRGSLIKPQLVSVDFIDREVAEHEAAASLGPKKIWIAILAAPFESSLVFDPDTDPALTTYPFSTEGPLSLPSAENLAVLAEQHFGSFQSAASEQAEPETAGVEARLDSLEKSLRKLADNLVGLSGVPRPSSAAVSASPKCPPGLPAAPATPAVADLDVVKSARAAGIPENQIAEMARLAHQQKPRLPDVPVRKTVSAKENPLDESEDEEPDFGLQQDGDAGGWPATSAGDPMVTAIGKLTQIAAQLASQKKTEKTLENLLDGAGSAASSESGSSGGSRRYAAALRALRKAVVSQPKAIYSVLEKNMEEDFNIQTMMPGSSQVQVSARAWLELRSRVQAYQTPVRLLWGVAGVWDALRGGRVEEARARCGLILAQGDQLSIDRGSWVVASEIALEDPPPMAPFQQHLLPSESEQPYTKLLDSRWLELFVSKLADIDNLNEKKRKLGAKRGGYPVPDVPPPPKADPKGKGKGKEKGKAKSGAEGQADPPATQ